MSTETKRILDIATRTAEQRAALETSRLTEAAAAERFAQLHSAHFRFDHRRQRWFVWDGHHWRLDDDGAVMRVALAFARQWQRDAVAIERLGQRDAELKFALQLERRNVISNVLMLAQALHPITSSGDDWDRDPWLLGVANGVVDLHTGTLRPGAPDDRITCSTTAAFDPAATCPRWRQFIDEIFAGCEGVASFVQRAVGYSITGITTEQVCFIGFGSGANGKGTFANTLKHVLGDYAWNMPFATIELRDRAAIPNDLAALAGRRLVVTSETNDGTRLNEARLKALTGCDPITARFLHGEFFEFDPVAKLWLSVNHKPIVRDDSYGFWRRIRLIPFEHKFPVNTMLGEALRAEAAGILAWCVEGAVAWHVQGLAAPAAVTMATAEYERESDPFGDFLREACELVPEAEVGASELYEHYRWWADQQGLGERERLTVTMFGRKMGERFKPGHNRYGKVYFGLARGPLKGKV